MSALSKSRAVNVRKEDSKRLEEESRRMEARLELLRNTMDQAETAKPGSAEGRWRSGSSSTPIRGYVKGVLDKPPAKTRPQPKAGSARSSAAPSPAPEGAVGELLVAGGGGSLSDRTQRAEALAASSQPRSQAAANLQAAMGNQSEESQEVEAFLGNLKLDRYVSIFLENGFDSMDVILEMQEGHMREIGMAVGHIVKLQKKLAELRPQPKAAQVGAEADVGSTQRRVSFGGTDEKKVAAVKVPAASLEQAGDFDEAESAASFQEALRAWREGGKPAAPKAPGSFWSSVGGDEVDLQRCHTPVLPPGEGTTQDGETQRDLAPSEDKLCCYICYKQFYKQFAVERSSPATESATPRVRPATGGGRKLFCSEACGDRWVTSMEEKAQAARKRQEKIDALREAERALQLQQQDQSGEAVECN